VAENLTNNEFWISVLLNFNDEAEANENSFDDSAQFAISVLLLPFSNAEVEWQMNLI
jgi:hypothetical protein